MGNFQNVFFCLAIAIAFVSADVEDPPVTTSSTPELISVSTSGKEDHLQLHSDCFPHEIPNSTPSEITTLPPKSAIDQFIESINLSATQFCPPNEVPSKCENCRKSCSIRELDPECLCVPGCICKPGYLRNFHGVCVPEDKCDSPCNGDLGRVFDPHGNRCARTCENIRDPNWKCDPLIHSPGGACKCIHGLVEIKGGHCVRPEDCNITCNDYNEVYSECMANNCQDTCMQPKKRLYCHYPFCKPGCVCLANYLRDHNGICIPKHSCSESCNGDPNARKITCTPQKRRTCANLNDWTVISPIVCDGTESCRCKDGYAEFDGVCLPRTLCPTCGKNELYLCRACDLVADRVIDQNCTQKIPCTEGCYCKLGYARNYQGNCVRLSKCGQRSCNGDPNAYFDQCNLNCEKTCENRNGPDSCDTDKCTFKGKCLCKRGFVKNSQGKCVVPQMCDYKQRSSLPVIGQKSDPARYQKCGSNEEYNKQTYAPQENTCEMFLIGQTSYAGEVCSRGCRCIPGFLRNKSGSCVMPQNCCEDSNAELISGPNTCPGGTCTCPKFELCEDRSWIPFGCQCKSGFLKISATNATCVSETECCNYV
ncbi:zonadhesin-like isoform X2 [Arctopsyche grandis]|uniref:zonadhesin-like isoform X2 n=1 Tax=Arctopsyche grandis TaxID=121162 RepID=UPI00406D8AAC